MANSLPNDVLEIGLMMGGELLDLSIGNSFNLPFVIGIMGVLGCLMNVKCLATGLVGSALPSLVAMAMLIIKGDTEERGPEDA